MKSQLNNLNSCLHNNNLNISKEKIKNPNSKKVSSTSKDYKFSNIN